MNIQVLNNLREFEKKGAVYEHVKTFAYTPSDTHALLSGHIWRQSDLPYLGILATVSSAYMKFQQLIQNWKTLLHLPSLLTLASILPTCTISTLWITMRNNSENKTHT